MAMSLTSSRTEVERIFELFYENNSRSQTMRYLLFCIVNSKFRTLYDMLSKTKCCSLRRLRGPKV